MVNLTPQQLNVMKTFGRAVRGKKFNHRVPIQYQRFQDSIDPDEIVRYHSRDDYHKLDRRIGERTYKDATQSLGRKNVLLPNLKPQDLEANHLFQQELDRQRGNIARVNKIRVLIDSIPGKGTELSMNQNISTPFECALHIHDLLTTRSVVAELVPLDTNSSVAINSSENGLVGQRSDQNNTANQQYAYWDMHRPIEDSCRLRFRHFTDNHLTEINKIYWRSCSFVLGMAIRMAFKDDVKVLLHSWPKPNPKSGSFVYDVALSLSEKWQPDEKELRAFTKVMWAIKNASLPFERLQVTKDLARDFFAGNPLKLSQIDSIVSNSSLGKVTVYRCGGLLDMSIGPMISNTSQIGRITLAAVHPFDTNSKEYDGIFYRFQGVSLPQQLPVSSYVYQNILINQAKKLNRDAL